MLYEILHLPARLALWFYCKHIRINRQAMLELKGPLLLACNHPNSFLDAIILCTVFRAPIYSLARGDVFKNKWLATILGSLKIYPVYRTREGVENLDLNYETFRACQEIFRRNGIVLIFSEGLCENEWHLRPLKKGTARIVTGSWQSGIPVRVLPVGLNYSSFKYFGKTLIVNFGDIISAADIDLSGGEGKGILNFNRTLYAQLQNLVYEIDENDSAQIKETFATVESPAKKTVLFLPALLGYAVHWPLYTLTVNYVKKRFGASGHFDSMVVGLLFMLYPFYLLLLWLLCWMAFRSPYALGIFLVAPFCAWSLLQVRKTV